MNLPDRISNWIRDKVIETHKEGVIVGLSGGIDSAVVAVLSKHSVGDKLLGIIMPCGYSNPEDEEDVNLLATTFDIRIEKIILTSIYDKLIEVLPPGPNRMQSNIKPRLRMLTLYYFANKLNYLVVGTGNKSEILTGYFTKYGDGGVDILPLGDILKTQVIELAKELRIPSKIIEKIPTAGLWEGQTDEGELGISYTELDKTILTIKSGNYTETDLITKIKTLISESEHKRIPIPIFNI
ncbi:MAG: NAD+ synthase [Candidatus Stahlbacteria bacterium]|nr:NAD+ synthase [Candidatus Stahlbacteria bacterium]